MFILINFIFLVFQISKIGTAKLWPGYFAHFSIAADVVEEDNKPMGKIFRKCR